MKEFNLEANPTDPELSAKSNDAVFRLRRKKVVDAFQDLEVEAVEAAALWGKHARETIMILNKSVSSLSVALDLYLRNLYSPKAGFLDNESREYFEKIVYKMTINEDEDKFTSELSSTINSIEQLVRPYLTK